MIQFHQVSKHYNAAGAALSDIDLSIDKSDFTFITGPSGAGKTTMLKLLFLSERPTKGEILINGVNIARMNNASIPLYRRRMGVVFQDFKLIPSKTVYENVAFALEILGTRRKTVKRKVWQVLKWVGLLSKRDVLPSCLSGGEQQRVAIARAIINNPVLLLADEPTGNLDHALSWEIMKLFKAINARGTTVIVATHNDELADRFARSTISLARGRILPAETPSG